jgi:methionine-rich copper-binding protein CopC
MTLARLALYCFVLDVLAVATANAQSGRVVETVPTANASIDPRSTGFSVRFDRPIDHIHSVLIIKRDGNVVATLQPRLKTAPDVLFAQASTLQPGQYTLVWQVRTLNDTEVSEGEIPFKVISTP